MNTSDRLESLLQESVAEGERADNGKFTINLRRALELMPVYQLSNPQDFMLRFVAAAVSSGATFLKIESLQPCGYRLCWDGSQISRANLESLLSKNLHGEHRMAELSIGLTATVARYANVKIVSNEGRLCISEGQVEYQTNEAPSDTMVVEMTTSGWRGWLTRLRPGSALVSLKQARFSPLRVTLPSGSGLEANSAGSAEISFGKSWSGTREQLVHLDTDPGIGEGLLSLGEPSQVTLVHLGVGYQLDRFLPNIPGHLIWWYDDVLIDLSRSGPVRNAVFTAWSDSMLREVKSGLNSAFERYPNRPEIKACQEWITQIDKITDKLEGLPPIHKSILENVRGGRFEQALTDASEAAKSDKQFLHFVALCLGLLERFSEASDTYRQLLAIFPKQPSLHSNFAENLSREGLQEEAEKQVDMALSLDAKYGHALALKAAFLLPSNPHQALKLAEHALGKKDCPASVWETLANIHKRLDDPVSERVSLQRFLDEADPSTLYENDLTQRLVKARRQLDALPPDPSSGKVKEAASGD